MFLLLAAALYVTSLEVRSQAYAMAVDVAAGNHYTIRVTSVPGNQTVITRETASIPFDDAADLPDDTHVILRIAPAPYGIMATSEIERDGTIVDSLHAVWTLTPHRSHLRAANALRCCAGAGREMKAPVLLHRIDPDAKMSGIVIVEALIDRNGNVKDAIILTPLPDALSDAALRAVRQWQFHPATLNGQPIDVVFDVTLTDR